MALICDTGGIYALYDADDTHHRSTKRVIETEEGLLFLPTVLLAEIDYLLTTRLGSDAALDFLESVQANSFTLLPFSGEDLARSCELLVQYRDLGLGLADASVVAAAERLKIPRLLTVDQRHFRAIRPHHFDHFVILPADSGEG